MPSVVLGAGVKPAPIGVDFFMANTREGHGYHDAVRDRLMAADVTPAERFAAMSVLHEIDRWLQANVSEKNAAELATLLAMDRSNMTRTLKLLEQIGAIVRVKRGQMKIIMVTRGNIAGHQEAGDRNCAEVAPPRLAEP